MGLKSGSRLGPYEIVSALGAGGMGQVYRAYDTRLNRAVAIKVLAPDRIHAADVRRQLAGEARAIAALNHPHICAVHDFGTQDGIDYLVMDFLDGDTLRDRLLTGPLPPAAALRYAIDVADALEHAHRHGFVHRDVNPSNVMLTKSGAVLLDFGLAEPLPHLEANGPASSNDVRTQEFGADETRRGTLSYMAPEYLEGRQADARTDIFAFGALLYEMLTGRQAFAGTSQASVIASILSNDPPPVTGVPPALAAAMERITRKALAKHPDDRWQSAHDLKTTLQWIVDPQWKDGGLRTVSSSAHRRERIAWIAATVILVGSLLAVTITRSAPDAAGGATDGPPVQFYVDPPENATLFPGGGVMALSPDGRHLALIATPTGGKPLLWIRSLHSVVRRPLAGTVGASQPFWSPDSRFVGFMLSGKLRKIDITTGEIQTVADVQGTAGTWSRDGVILFKSDVSNRIERVAANGGIPAPVAALNPSGGEWFNWPHFLPDGRRFLYFVKSPQPDTTGVYVTALDGMRPVRVLGDESQAVFVGSGYLLFLRDGAVVAQRFDPETLRLTGEAVPVVRDVAFNFATRRGVFSVSETGVLAFRASADSLLEWFDRSGRSLGTIGPAGQYHDPVISPDGKTVAVGRLDRQLGTHDLWLLDGERGSAERFTFDPGWDRAPVWSPDGGRVAFASRRGDKFELYIKAAAGNAAEHLLLRPPGTGGHPVHWSRDGRFVVFAQAAPDTHFDLWALPTAPTSEPFALVATEANEYLAQVSPDGRWLAFDSNEGGSSEVWVQPFAGPTGRRRRISTGGGFEPKWRKDGGELFYLGTDGRLMSVRVLDRETFAADPPRTLFETASIGPHVWTLGRNRYDVAPDGTRILINVPDPKSSPPVTIVAPWTAMLSR